MEVKDWSRLSPWCDRQSPATRRHRRSKEWIIYAKHWLKNRSSGSSISKDEIKIRKKRIRKTID